MYHKWNNSTWEKKGYKVCRNCGTSFQKGFPAIYFRPYNKDMPFFYAGDCKRIQQMNERILNEATDETNKKN